MSIKIITGEQRYEGSEVLEGLKSRRILPIGNNEPREKAVKKMFYKMTCKMKDIYLVELFTKQSKTCYLR